MISSKVRGASIIAIASLIFAACGGGGGTTGSPVATGAASPAASPAGSPAGSGTTGSPAASPGQAAPINAAGKTICFAFQDLETEFWVAGHTSIVQAMQKAGGKVIEQNGQQDANKQLEQVRSCIAQHVDGIIIIPQDGESAVTIIGEANKANVPLGVFNRPPSTQTGAAIVVVADNHSISQQAMEYMAGEAKKLSQANGGRKIQPLIMVGDLGDPNAVERKAGFDAVIAANPDLFEKPIEVATKWDAETGRAGLENALQKNPNIDLLFTSSDFLYPQIRSVLEPLGRWKKIGEKGHVIMGGIDGDSTACGLMRDGYVDATGVQNLFFEADAVLRGVVDAVNAGDTHPNRVIPDLGFALTQANMSQREKDMWGCVIPPPAK